MQNDSIQNTKTTAMVQTTNSQQQNSAAQITDESSQRPLQNQSVADVDTEISSRPCRCKKGCSTEQCGCVKAGIPCGERCKCKRNACNNQVETANSQQQSNAAQVTDESSQRPLQNQSVADVDTEISSRPCRCKKGCSTEQCGCVKAGIPCGERCKCKRHACNNQVETANSQQQSNAAQVTGESSQRPLQNQSVADVDTEISSRPCRCKKGCSTEQCGCVKAGIPCGERCKCKRNACNNQVETANSQQQSNAAQVTGESSQRPLQNQSVADVDTEISSRPCTCKKGCSTKKCGCVKAGIPCGERCKCKRYSCNNQVESNAAQVLFLFFFFILFWLFYNLSL
ncbi:protein lin-54-like [Bombus pascuorum]|uniref:protein lin-54-like n=1 Tax=Bombus pascuorum TaxID=65598 RepID=UPI00298E24B4|nr:protein lin-54-like [Bombus pascuorum]